MLYESARLSLYIQFITGIIDTWGLNMKVPVEKELFRTLLKIELGVQMVEFVFYYWLVKNIKTHPDITRYRYFDWMITTPTMLFTYSMYLLITEKIEKNKEHSLLEVINSEKYTLIIIILLNWLMLFFGYMGELGKLSVKLSTFLGFIPFIIMFYIIYENYAKYTSIGLITFIYFVSAWALYGIAALMNYKVKNIMYNILDLFAKNFFALFLAYILIFKYAYPNTP